MLLLEEFHSVLLRCGARQVGTRHYGLWEEFPFSAHVDRAKEPGAVTFEFRLAASLENGLFKTLRKAFPKGCQLTAAAGSSYRLVCAGGPLKKTDATLASLLTMLTRSLREAGIAPADVCPVCHRTGCDAYADLNGYTPVHRACVETLTETQRSQAEKAVRSGSYVTGLIGAILGGLAACIPTILAYLAGWLVAYLYALVPLGAYYGYKLFRGRMNRGAFLCTCIASVLHLFSIEQIEYYIAVHQYYDIWPSITDTVRLYLQNYTLGESILSMGMSIVFMGLGLWISWGQIRRTAYTDLGAANTVQSTLTDKVEPLF